MKTVPNNQIDNKRKKDNERKKTNPKGRRVRGEFRHRMTIDSSGSWNWGMYWCRSRRLLFHNSASDPIAIRKKELRVLLFQCVCVCTCCVYGLICVYVCTSWQLTLVRVTQHRSNAPHPYRFTCSNNGPIHPRNPACIFPVAGCNFSCIPHPRAKSIKSWIDLEREKNEREMTVVPLWSHGRL